MSDTQEELDAVAAVDSPDCAAAAGEPGPRSLMPLVLVPLFIVGAFVAVIVLFGWLATGGTRPDELVDRLQRADRSSFRAAVMLVQILRDPADPALRRDEQLARQLSTILQNELASGSFEPERIQLRSFLCRALGEMERGDVLPVLIQAAETQRDPSETEVRRSALEAIAQVVARQQRHAAQPEPRVLQAVLTATRSPEPGDLDSLPRDALRATAAFTLGVLGGDEAEMRLVSLLEDRSPDVRFNAATGLARHGRAEAESVLLEMLDPHAMPVVEAETTAQGKAWRRQMVLRNALRSVESLLAANRQLDDDRLIGAVHKLTRYPDDRIVQQHAQRTVQALHALPR